MFVFGWIKYPGTSSPRGRGKENLKGPKPLDIAVENALELLPDEKHVNQPRG